MASLNIPPIPKHNREISHVKKSFARLELLCTESPNLIPPLLSPGSKATRLPQKTKYEHGVHEISVSFEKKDMASLE